MNIIRKSISFFSLLKAIYERRRSVREAESIMIAPYQLNTYKKVCPGKKMFFFPHFMKVLDYNLLLEQKKTNKKIICERIRAENFIFTSTRHYWKGRKKLMSDNKGNDIILQAFATYLKLSNDRNTKLIFIEKGPDVEASKALAKKLAINPYIIWEKEMPKGELDKYYQGATICLGQFGTPVLSYATLEPLAHATPCISFYKVEASVLYYKELPPIVNTKNPHEITKKIYKIMIQKEDYSKICYESWKWAKENCSEEKFVQAFLSLFREKKDENK